MIQLRLQDSMAIPDFTGSPPIWEPLAWRVVQVATSAFRSGRLRNQKLECWVLTRDLGQPASYLTQAGSSNT